MKSRPVLTNWLSLKIDKVDQGIAYMAMNWSSKVVQIVIKLVEKIFTLYTPNTLKSTQIKTSFLRKS
jgi:hypothetical protein